MIFRLTKIRAKLTAALMLTALLASAVTSTTLLAYSLAQRIAALGDDLVTTANALGETCHATIAFDIPSEAEILLQTLKSKPTVALAGIFVGDSRLFAGYRRDGQAKSELILPEGPYPLRRLSWHSLEVVNKIVIDGEHVGYFYLRDDLSGIWSTGFALLAVIPLGVIIALGATYFTIRHLQRAITEPVLALAATAENVTRENNYSLRASKQSPDEIGELTDAFNRMLSEIQAGSMALGNSEKRYRNLLATAPLPILVHLEGILLYLNPAAAAFLQQQSSEALIGQSLLPFLASADDQASLLQPDEQSSSAATLHRFPLRFLLPNAEVRDFEVSAIDIDYEGCSSKLLICLDVTEKLAALHALEDYRHQLEELVEERTTELHKAQEQLIAKERLAVIGQLTATVSHELRNPLNSIGNALFNLKLALEAKREDLLNKSLQIATRNIDRCDRIINDLLDYSREGKIKHERIAVDQWLQELLDELAWPEQIRLHTELRSDACIWGDSDRLRQAVLNLIINAQQALLDVDEGEKVIQIASRAAKDRLGILVEDNGPGIPLELRSKIFEPLFSTKVYGIGLGMAVVEDVAKCHLGEIELQTPEGGGSRFILWLPSENNEGGESAKNSDC